MKGIGNLLVLFGVGSFVLNAMGREFTLLLWIDTWGPMVGNAIRIGMAVVGGGLWYAGARQEAAQVAGPSAPGV